MRSVARTAVPALTARAVRASIGKLTLLEAAAARLTLRSLLLRPVVRRSLPTHGPSVAEEAWL